MEQPAGTVRGDHGPKIGRWRVRNLSNLADLAASTNERPSVRTGRSGDLLGDLCFDQAQQLYRVGRENWQRAAEEQARKEKSPKKKGKRGSKPDPAFDVPG